METNIYNDEIIENHWNVAMYRNTSCSIVVLLFMDDEKPGYQRINV